jgi:hypothetical protein
MTIISSGSRLSRAIDGSLQALVKGWLWGASPFVLAYVVGYPIALICMIPHLFLTWLLVCLPIYYLEDYKAIFKNRRRCIWYGVLGGPLMLIYLPLALYLCIPARWHENDASGLISFLVGSLCCSPIAMIIGGVACSEACANRAKYMYEDIYDTSSQPTTGLNFSLAPSQTSQVNYAPRS